jgi:hypothetical protein
VNSAPAPRAPVPSPPLLLLSAATVSASTARAPAPSPRCGARSAAIHAPVTASQVLHLRSRAAARMSETTPRARSGSRTWSAPSSRCPERRSSSRHRRTRVPAAARTRARLHRRKRRHTADAPMPRRLARKCLQGRKRRSPCARIGRHGMVAASGKAATATHRPSAAISQKPTARSSAPTSALVRRRARRARFGRLSPRRVLPPWTPQPGHPPDRSLAWARSLNKESPGGKDALARRRSEWPRTATAGSPRGDGARPRPPVAPLPLPAPATTTGACSVQCDGPGWRGASITSRPTARSQVTAAAALAGAAAARACALRLGVGLGQRHQRTRPAAQRLQRGSLRSMKAPLAATEASAEPLRK